MAPDVSALSMTLDGLIGSADHKTIGRGWISAGLLFLVAATVITVLAGFEATDFGSFAIVEDGDQFAQVWSLGRELLLFGAIVPILIGLATYLVPLQVGAPAVVFARGAAGAFWTWLLATGLLIGAYLLNGGPGGGRADFVVLWAIALGVMVVSLAWAMITIATTILAARTRGMTLERVPLTTWSFLVFSIVGLLSLPVLIVELVVIYVQVRHGFLPLGSRLGLTGVLESMSLAPIVYWVALPVLGMAVDIIGVHTSQPVRAHRPVMVAIGALGVLVYSADHFGLASVRLIDLNHELLVIAIAASVLPVFAVLVMSANSLRRGKVRITTALVGALISVLVLLLAAAASLLALGEPVALFINDDTSASLSLDNLLVLNGTTFHDGIRGMVLGAVIVAIVAALHHWAPKLWGRRLSETLGMASILAAAGGAVLWGLGAILAGIDDQAAYPVATLVGGGNVELYNMIAAIGMVLVAIAAIALTVNVLGAAFGSNSNDGDGWSGTTLEWATSSPPPFGNFDSPPVVRSATPLLDGPLAQGDAVDAAGESPGQAGTATEPEGSP